MLKLRSWFSRGVIFSTRKDIAYSTPPYFDYMWRLTHKGLQYDVSLKMLQTIYALHLFVFWIKAVIFNTRFFLSLLIWSPKLLFDPVRLRYKWWLFKLVFWLFIIKRMYFWFFWHKTYSAWPSWNIIFATPISSFVWIVKRIWYTLLIQHLKTLIFGHYDQSLNSPQYFTSCTILYTGLCLPCVNFTLIHL